MLDARPTTLNSLVDFPWASYENCVPGIIHRILVKKKTVENVAAQPQRSYVAVENYILEQFHT